VQQSSATTFAMLHAATVAGTLNVAGVASFPGGATAPTRTAGDNTTNVATTAFVTAQQAADTSRLQPGDIFPSGASTRAGAVLCDGTAYSRTGATAALFAAIGTSYGIGDGSTTFNVPNFQQRFLLGKAASGTGSTLGATGGSIDHVHLGDDHFHDMGFTTIVEQSARFAAGGVTGLWLPFVGPSGPLSDTGNVGSGSGLSNTGPSNPPFQTANYFIKL
jgi:hypothetical protein